jgi:hypothetical protein
VLEYLTPFEQMFGAMSHKLVWERPLQGPMSEGKDDACCDAYAEEVKAAVPTEKLLVFEVDQGRGNVLVSERPSTSERVPKHE